MNKNKVVLITGGSRGIGRELALNFSKNGFFVVINYLKEKNKAESIINEINKNGNKSAAFQANIANFNETCSLIKKTADIKGSIDVLINNAGICKDKTILLMSENQWTDVINTNLNGAFFVLKECSKIMAKQKYGSIINIASITGVRGSFGSANYTSSKAGLINLTKTAAKELGRFNICVNAILPGFHATDMGQSAPASYYDKIKQESVLGLTTDIKELAKFTIFLSQMKTVSGQIFNWDSRIL